MKLKKCFLVLSFVIPLTVMSALAFVVGTLLLTKDIALSGKTLLRVSSDISATSWRVLTKASKLADSPCPEMLNALTRTRAFTPYIRDIGVLDNDEITCSFVSGDRSQRFSQISGLSLPDPLPERLLLAVKRMAEGPGRPALLWAEKISPAKAVFVIVDSQYVQELIDILAAERASVLSLTFGSGSALVSHTVNAETPFLTRRFTSGDGEIQLLVETPFSTLSVYWIQNLLIFIPLSLCISFISIIFYRRWRQKRLSWGKEIERGMADNEFLVHYQPVHDVRGGTCGGVEALLRWPQADGRFIPPGIFIPAAENEGIIVALTRHLFRLIADDVRTWNMPEGFYISVNIAADHLNTDAFLSDVMMLREQLGKYTLILEITERSLIAEPDVVAAKLASLRDNNVKIAIDDFGTGYCSLSYLQQLPADFLKIDRSFINTIDTSHSEVPVLDTIITLSQKLGLQVVAEGVSTEHQLRYVREHDVNYIQGYLYARPMSSEDFRAWLWKDARRQNELISK